MERPRQRHRILERLRVYGHEVGEPLRVVGVSLLHLLRSRIQGLDAEKGSIVMCRVILVRVCGRMLAFSKVVFKALTQPELSEYCKIPKSTFFS